jgi:uncharacterized protein (DUF2147 family)
MKSIIQLLFFFVLFQAETIFGQSITGKWKTEDNTIIEVLKNDANTYVMKQISAGKEVDKKYNNQQVAKNIIGEKSVFSGIVIDPSNNKEYKAKWTLSANQKQLNLSVKWGLFSFNETWQRIN